MILTFMWRRGIIYPLKAGSFEYSLHVIFLLPPPRFSICWYRGEGDNSEMRGRMKALRKHFLDEWARGAFSSFASSPMWMAWECYITSFFFLTEKTHRLASETRLNLHYNEFSWTFGCICIRLCCFLFTSHNIFSTLLLAFSPLLKRTSLKLRYFDYFLLTLNSEETFFTKIKGNSYHDITSTFTTPSRLV